MMILRTQWFLQFQLGAALALALAAPHAQAEEISRWKRPAAPQSGAATLSAPQPTETPAPKSAPSRAKARTAPKKASDEIDLSALDDAGSSKSSPAAASGPSETGPPVGAYSHYSKPSAEPGFKLYFDLLLHRRPGISPITFDTYHTLLLLEIAPNADFQFAFEVSPSPRYYELDWQLTPKLTLRLGRIWIPFDSMNPHNMFGGWIYTSKLSQPTARSVFLPDLWTDLGVGLRYTLLDSKALAVTADAYMVNGFQDGGVDPKNQVSIYPSFSSPSGVDNNGDKGFGGRINALIGGRFSLGASFYTDRYSDAENDSYRTLMIGADGSIRFPTTEVRAGYIVMTVGLPAPATDGFSRGALYAEVMQRLGQKWRIFARGGTAQNDNRVLDVTDRQVIGGSLQYDAVIYKIEAQHLIDLNDVPGKSGKTFSALRFVVSL